MSDPPKGAFPIGINVIEDNQDIVLRFVTVIANYEIRLPVGIFDAFHQLCAEKLNEAKSNKLRNLTSPKLTLPNGVNIRKEQN